MSLFILWHRWSLVYTVQIRHRSRIHPSTGIPRNYCHHHFAHVFISISNILKMFVP